MPFISSVLGVVAHPINVLSEYLQKLNRRQKCKAAILSWLDSFTQSKLKKGESEWIRVVVGDLAQELGWHPETIRLHLHQLLEEGLIERRPANWYRGDAAFAYRLCVERLLEFLDIPPTSLLEIPLPPPQKSGWATRKRGVHLKSDPKSQPKRISPPTPSREGNEKETKEVRVELEGMPEEATEISFTYPVNPDRDIQLKAIDCSSDSFSAQATHHKRTRLERVPAENESHSQAVREGSSSLGISRSRPRGKSQFPDGPWLTASGCLDDRFLEDRARLWMMGDTVQAQAFGKMAIEDVKSLVASHYLKVENHAKLELDYGAFVAKNQRYLQNVRTRIQEGASIPVQEISRIAEAIPVAFSERTEAHSQPTSLPEFAFNFHADPLQLPAPIDQPDACAKADEAITVDAEAVPHPSNDDPQPIAQACNKDSFIENPDICKPEGLTPEELLENQKRLRRGITERLRSRQRCEAISKLEPIEVEPRKQRWTWESASAIVASGDCILIAEAMRWAQARGGEVVRDASENVLEILPAF